MLLEITSELHLQIEHIESIEEKKALNGQDCLQITMRSGKAFYVPDWTMKTWDQHIAKMMKLMQLSQSRMG